MNTQQIIEIPCVTNDGRGASYFINREISLEGDSARRLSAQINAVNFRLRSSDASYCSDYHVAGDPTLLIVLSGTVKIQCLNGSEQTFSAGEMFIAQDYLESGVEFDATVHGHRADVIGEAQLRVLHLKLDRRK